MGLSRRITRATLPLIVLAMASVLPPSEAAELLGPAPVSYPSGDEPRSIALVDFDDDGNVDLAVCNRLGRNVTLFQGDGRGGFIRTVDLPVGNRPSAIAADDLNGDGIDDLVVANFTSNTITVLLGDGATFHRVEPDQPVGKGARSVAIADFDADGKLDVATADWEDATVTLAIGDGSGGFAATRAIAVGTNPGTVVTADLNHDGVPDLAVANFGIDTVSLLIGHGKGEFTIDSIGTGSEPFALVFEDFDGDGNEDLAVGNFGDATVQIFRGLGTGSLAVGVKLDLADGAGPAALATGDLNRDGIVDLVVTNQRGNTVSLLVGDGEGGFSGTGDVLVGSNPFATLIHDFSADGALDLAVAEGGADRLTILRGNGLGGFPGSVRYAVGERPEGIAVADFDPGSPMPGGLDLAVASSFDNTVSLLLGDGQGGLTPPRSFEVGRFPSFVTAGDFDGDGTPDLAVVNEDDNTVSVLTSDGLGGFERHSIYPVGTRPRSIAIGDFDSDGHLDLAVANLVGVGSPTLLINDRSGGFRNGEAVNLGEAHLSVASGDFDRDGKVDLALTNTANDSVRILRGDGTGRFPFRTQLATGGLPRTVVIADFDRDSDDDLAVTVFGTDSVQVFLGDGRGAFSGGIAIPVGTGPDSLAVGDFNKDGIDDLAVGLLTGDAVSVLLGSGDGQFSHTVDLGAGRRPRSVRTLDINADGADDLVMSNLLGGTVALLYSQIDQRADVNGSNRVDGFDVNALGRHMGCTAPEPCYRRTIDTDLDGIIGGEDLAQVAFRFGDFIRQDSPLRPAFDPAAPVSAPNTVTFQQAAALGDLLTVDVLVNDVVERGVAAARFEVLWSAAVLEYAGFDPGTYFAEAGVQPLYSVNDETPGRVAVTVNRFPNLDATVDGSEPVLSLFLRGRSEGETQIDFGSGNGSALLDRDGNTVAEIAFVGGAGVNVVATGGGAPGQRIGLSPDSLEFGRVTIGASRTRKLRISNFGFSRLTIEDVSASLPEARPFFVSPFEIPAFGFIELQVELAPGQPGMLAGTLSITSDDPDRPMIHLPMSATAVLRP